MSNQKITGMVTYGSDIQLMHRDSGMYLCAKNECSQTEQIGYKLHITDIFSSRMIFSFEPKFKSRKTGDLIQYTDFLRIKNVKTDNFLCISPTNSRSPRDLVMNNQNPFIVHKILYDTQSSLYPIYLGDGDFNSWQLFFHSTQSRNSGEKIPIIGNDLVRIRHSELNALLASSLCFESKTPEIYFMKYTGEHEEEELGMNTIWEISHQKQVYQGKNFNLREDHQILLRHFNSGKILSIDLETGNAQLEFIKNHLGPQDEPISLTFRPIQIGINSLVSNSSYKILMNGVFPGQDELEGTENYLTQSDKFLRKNDLDNSEKAKELQREIKFTPLEDIYFDRTRNRACFSYKKNVEEAYSLILVSEREKRDMFYLRSAIFQLNQLAKHYKENIGIPVDHQLLVDSEFVLKNILSFLYDVEYNSDLNYLDFGDKEPKNEKQKMLKDFNFLELFIEIIHYPFKNHFYEIKEVQNTLYVPQIISLCFTSIRIGIMEYRPSELYASQWLDLMIEYSLGDLHDGMRANETLTELIDNNYRILETRIKDDTIDKFVNNLISSGVDKKFVEILRAICICDEKPMIKNQTSITTIMLEDADTRENIILPLENRDNIICVKDPWMQLKDEWKPLSDLKTLSETRDKGKYYEYYNSLIFLLADLCQDRNYKAIKKLWDYFSVEICANIICSKNGQYSYSIRSAFCKLMQNLRIDCYPFIPIRIPTTIKDWNNYDESHNIDSIQTGGNAQEIEQFSGFKDFVFDFMGKARELDDWTECGTFMLNVIQLCK